MPRAVTITLTSRTVQNTSALVVSWINHYGNFTTPELRPAHLASYKLRTHYRRRLLFNWLNFALFLVQLKLA